MKRKAATKVPLTLAARTPEPLTNATATRPWCQRCGAWAHARTPFMRAWVPERWTRRVLVVGERPGRDEDTRTGRPFTGPSGQALQRWLRAAGLGPDDVAYTNAVRCADPRNRPPTMTQIRCCRAFLLTELQELRPNLVVGLGDSACRALLDDGTARVTSYRGRRLTVPGLPPLDDPHGGAAARTEPPQHPPAEARRHGEH